MKPPKLILAVLLTVTLFLSQNSRAQSGDELGFILGVLWIPAAAVVVCPIMDGIVVGGFSDGHPYTEAGRTQANEGPVGQIYDYPDSFDPCLYSPITHALFAPAKGLRYLVKGMVGLPGLVSSAISDKGSKNTQGSLIPAPAPEHSPARSDHSMQSAQ